MGMKSLMSVAQAAGYAMAASEELLTPTGKAGAYETRGLEHGPTTTSAVPARWAQSVQKVEWRASAEKATAVRDWVAAWWPTRATA